MSKTVIKLVAIVLLCISVVECQSRLRELSVISDDNSVDIKNVIHLQRRRFKHVPEKIPTCQLVLDEWLRICEAISKVANLAVG